MHLSAAIRCDAARSVALKYGTVRYATVRSPAIPAEVLVANSARLRPAGREFQSVLVCSVPPAINSALSHLSRDVLRPISRRMLIIANCPKAMDLIVTQWLACECVWSEHKKNMIFKILVRGGI